MKYENGDSIRGETPLAGGWGCPPFPSNIPQEWGDRGVERVIFEGIPFPATEWDSIGECYIYDQTQGLSN